MQGMGGNPMMVQQRMQMQGAQMGQMGQMNPNMQQRMMRPGVQVQGMYVLCNTIWNILNNVTQLDFTKYLLFWIQVDFDKSYNSLNNNNFNNKECLEAWCPWTNNRWEALRVQGHPNRETLWETCSTDIRPFLNLWILTLDSEMFLSKIRYIKHFVFTHIN